MFRKQSVSLKTRDHIRAEDFTTSYRVGLRKPRMWSDLSEAEYLERCIALCDEAIKSLAPSMRVDQWGWREF